MKKKKKLPNLKSILSHSRLPRRIHLSIWAAIIQRQHKPPPSCEITVGLDVEKRSVKKLRLQQVTKLLDTSACED